MAKKSVAKGATRYGELLSLLRANGEWMAVVAALSSFDGDPVISKIVRVHDIQGPQRKKADRWIGLLA